MTIDHRLFSESGRSSIASDFKNLGTNLKAMREKASESPLKIGVILNAPNTLLEGAIYTFTEEKDVKGGAVLRTINPVTGEVNLTTNPAATEIYALNGINNTDQDIINSYFKDNTILTERENPTHGLLGDLVESGLGKIANWFGLEEIIAMNRIAAEDIYERRNIPNAINLYHSQGTIIGEGAMQVYAGKYGEQIDPSQRFIAVGPAVTKEDWRNTIHNLGFEWNDDNYKHDSKDPVRYLTAPSNVINQTVNLFKSDQSFKSTTYIPNLLEIPVGIWNLQNMPNHSVTNKIYFEPLTNSSTGQNSQNLNTDPPK